MSNLLDKASIILTPTAYNNGEALCVKPSDGSGDFDFSRNSAATRVNAQGLVENVQILSSNLVQNPSFSEEGVQEVSNGSFSQEGVQLITNGSFDTDSNWTLSSGITYNSNGYLDFNLSSGQARNTPNITFVQGKTYKVVYEIKNYVSGDIKCRFQNGVNTILSQQSGNGVKTEYIVCEDSSNNNFQFFGSSSFIGSIDNCSVREVGQDWTLDTGWSVLDGVAHRDGSATNSNIEQVDILDIGKTYKITYTIQDYVGGTIRFRAALISGASRTANGTYTEYITVAGTSFEMQGFNGFEGSITNISVKEVGMDWTFQAKWSIGSGFAQLISNDSAGSSLIPNTSTISGNKYNCSFDAVVSSGSCKLQGSSGTTYQIIDETKTYNFNFVADSGAIYFNRLSAISNITITNVNIVLITDDTNLPRINYENFSYQDALGSELNTNTYIADKSANLTLNGTELQIDNGGENYARARVNAVLVSGKTYRAKVTCVNQGTNGASFYVLSARPFGTINMISGETYEVTFVADSFYTPFYENKVGGTGLIVDNISIKEYLGQEVVPNSGCGSWLWEPQSTNLITQSELFSGWNVFGVDLTSDAIIAPDGTLSGTLATSTGSLFDQIKINTTGSGDATFSVFVKKLTDDTIDFEVRGVGIGTSTSSQVKFTFSTEQISLISNGVPSSTLVENYGNGWFRISLTYQGTTSVDSVSIIPSYASSTIRSAYIWGAMLEQNSYPTSLIPTSGSTVTRNQDVCNNGGSLATINSTSGVLYAEIAALANDGTNRAISINDGTNTNRVSFSYSASNNLLVVSVISSGTSIFNSFQSIPTPTDYLKVAISYKLNNFKVYINGSEVLSNTSGNTPIGLSQLDFNQAGSNKFFGKTKALAVFPYLSDQELTELTTI